MRREVAQLTSVAKTKLQEFTSNRRTSRTDGRATTESGKLPPFSAKDLREPHKGYLSLRNHSKEEPVARLCSVASLP